MPCPTDSCVRLWSTLRIQEVVQDDREAASASSDSEGEEEPSPLLQVLSLKKAEGGGGSVVGNCVRWSPDGHLLAAATENGVVFIWSGLPTNSPSPAREHWTLLCEVALCTGTSITDLAWAPDGSQLAAACVDCIVRLVEFKVGEGHDQQVSVGAELHGHTEPVRGVAWDPVGLFLTSQGADHRAITWAIADGSLAPRSVLQSPFSPGSACAPSMRCSWDAAGTTVAAASGYTAPRFTVPILLPPSGSSQAEVDLSKPGDAGASVSATMVGHMGTVCAVRCPPYMLQRTTTSVPLNAFASGDTLGTVAVTISDKSKPLAVVALPAVPGLPGRVTDFAWGWEPMSAAGVSDAPHREHVLLAATEHGVVYALFFEEGELGQECQLPVLQELATTARRAPRPAASLVARRRQQRLANARSRLDAKALSAPQSRSATPPPANPLPIQGPPSVAAGQAIASTGQRKRISTVHVPSPQVTLVPRRIQSDANRPRLSLGGSPGAGQASAPAARGALPRVAPTGRPPSQSPKSAGSAMLRMQQPLQASKPATIVSNQRPSVASAGGGATRSSAALPAAPPLPGGVSLLSAAGAPVAINTAMLATESAAVESIRSGQASSSGTFPLASAPLQDTVMLDAGPILGDEARGLFVFQLRRTGAECAEAATFVDFIASGSIQWTRAVPGHCTCVSGAALGPTAPCVAIGTHSGDFHILDHQGALLAPSMVLGNPIVAVKACSALPSSSGATAAFTAVTADGLARVWRLRKAGPTNWPALQHEASISLVDPILHIAREGGTCALTQVELVASLGTTEVEQPRWTMQVRLSKLSPSDTSKDQSRVLSFCPRARAWSRRQVPLGATHASPSDANHAAPSSVAGRLFRIPKVATDTQPGGGARQLPAVPPLTMPLLAVQASEQDLALSRSGTLEQWCQAERALVDLTASLAVHSGVSPECRGGLLSALQHQLHRAGQQAATSAPDTSARLLQHVLQHLLPVVRGHAATAQGPAGQGGDAPVLAGSEGIAELFGGGSSSAGPASASAQVQAGGLGAFRPFPTLAALWDEAGAAVSTGSGAAALEAVGGLSHVAQQMRGMCTAVEQWLKGGHTPLQS